jgi:hypothetical protein
MQSYIHKGIEEGAEVLVGGESHPPGFDAGYFVKPTVFVNVRNDMTIAQEEIFGPVLCVIAYDTEEDAIRIANDTKIRPPRLRNRGTRHRARAPRGLSDPGRPCSNQRYAGPSRRALGRVQVLRHRPRIRQLRDRGVSRNPGHPRVTTFGVPALSKEISR